MLLENHEKHLDSYDEYERTQCENITYQIRHGETNQRDVEAMTADAFAGETPFHPG